MDRTELMRKLGGFKQACVEAGCINIDDENALELEEAYPGMIPTSFIVNVTVRKKWLEDRYSGNALKELIKLLYDTADPEALENILTIRICGEDEWYSVELSQPKESA